MHWLILIALLAAALLLGLRRPRGRGARLFHDTGRHYRRCYSRRGFLKLGGAVVAACALIYSGADELVESWHAGDVRSGETDALARRVRGPVHRLFFLYWGLFAALDALWSSNALTRWGRRNFEAMVVGLPTLWTLQYGLGASRPTDAGNVAGPRWRRPLHDNNSASGDAFMGAVPILTAARATSVRGLRWTGFVASTASGWTRLNDRKHYLSQVWLGWYAAWHAVSAVMPETRNAQRTNVMRPEPAPSAESTR